MPSILFRRSVRFSASHSYQIDALPKHENRRMFGAALDPHDHQWQLTIWLEGPIDPVTGMMIDLNQVDTLLQREVVDRFQGKHINEVDAFFLAHQPTNEVLAGYFAQLLGSRFLPARLAKLRICESEDLCAEWIA